MLPPSPLSGPANHNDQACMRELPLSAVQTRLAAAAAAAAADSHRHAAEGIYAIHLRKKKGWFDQLIVSVMGSSHRTGCVLTQA